MRKENFGTINLIKINCKFAKLKISNPLIFDFAQVINHEEEPCTHPKSAREATIVVVIFRMTRALQEKNLDRRG